MYKIIYCCNKCKKEIFEGDEEIQKILQKIQQVFDESLNEKEEYVICNDCMLKQEDIIIGERKEDVTEPK